MTVYTWKDAHKFLDGVSQRIEIIKNEYKKELQPQKLTELKEIVEENERHWGKEKAEILKSLDAQKPAKKVLNIPNLSADEITVLNYKANILKTYFLNANDTGDLEAIKKELLESQDKQLQQAFLYNYPMFKSLQTLDNAKDKSNNQGQSFLEGRYQSIISNIYTELNELHKTQEQKEIEAKIEEIDKQILSINMQFMTIEGKTQGLKNRINSETWGSNTW